MWEKILKAIRKGDTFKVVKLIEQIDPAVLNESKERGYTLLHHAVKNNNKSVCEVLISKMDDYAINAQSDKGKTALHVAFSNLLKCKSIFKILVPLTWPKFIIEPINANDFSIVGEITHKGSYKLFKFLFNNTNVSLVNIQDNNGWTPLHTSLISPEQSIEKSIYLIPLMNIDAINSKTKDNETALELAWINGNLDIFQFLLISGANSPDEELLERISRKMPAEKNIVNKLLETSKIVDKVYKGEKIEEVICEDYYEFFALRLSSLLLIYGMPKGWINIKDEILKNNIPGTLIEKFLENLSLKLTEKILQLKDFPNSLFLDEELANTVITYEFRKKLLDEGGIKGTYKEYINFFQKTYSDILPQKLLDKFISFIKDMQNSCLVFEAEFISHIFDVVSPIPLTILIERSLNKKDENFSKEELFTINFYSNIYPDCYELIKKFENNSITPTETDELVNKVKNHAGEYVYTLLQEQREELQKAIENHYSSKEENEIIQTLKNLLNSPLPCTIQKKLQEFLEPLEEKFNQPYNEEGDLLQDQTIMNAEPTPDETPNLLGFCEEASY